ncbi:hypothetical protein ACYA9X_03075, partial [Klebsiella pneumoniae]
QKQESPHKTMIFIDLFLTEMFASPYPSHLKRGCYLRGVGLRQWYSGEVMRCRRLSFAASEPATRERISSMSALLRL